MLSNNTVIFPATTHPQSQGSSVTIVTRLQAEWPGLNSWQRQGIFLFATTSKPALGPNQPPIEGVQGAPSLWVEWLGHGVDHSPSSNAKVKNAWSYTSTPSTHTHGTVVS